MGVELRQELQEKLDDAEWAWIQPHALRGAVICVSHDLSVVEVGYLVAADDTFTVEAWIGLGKLTRPTSAQMVAWDANPKKLFQVLIVDPYVLIQERLLN